MFWGEKEIEELNMPSALKELYDQEFSYPGKADIARLYILYKYGGIYIDADAVWVNEKSYDQLIEEAKSTGLFAGYETEKPFIANGFVGTYKENPQIKYLMDILPENYKLRRYQLPWIVSGPLFWNILVEEGRPITAFPSIYFYFVRWHKFKDPEHHKKSEIPKESYSYHIGIDTNSLEYEKLLPKGD